MTTRQTWILAKIASEGYCCLAGYLRLCKARGESVPDMAKNLEISPDAIWYHYRKLKGEKIGCMQYRDCMQPIIEEIEKSP